MADSPDQAFARFCETGSPDALGQAFDAVAPSLLLVAARLAPAGVDAEDLLQQTFLEAIRRSDRYDRTRPLSAWLVGILVKCAQAERRRGDRHLDPERIRSSAEADPGVVAEAEELARHVYDAATGLPTPYRLSSI